MPKLKQLSCSLELGGKNHVLTDYGTSYSDGHVQSYIAVPSEPVNFSVHLTSSGYIAPGLAMFVYMDGQYQCNRNRRGLVVPGPRVKPEHYEVDLRVRQKEMKQADGTFLGRDWSFCGLNLVSADKIEATNETFLENMGTIEVIVLRCKEAPLPPPTEQPKKPSHLVSSKPSSYTYPSMTSKPASAPPNIIPSRSAPKPASAPKPSIQSVSIKNLPARAIPSKPHSTKPSFSKPKSSKSESSSGMMGAMFDGPSDEPPSSIKPYWATWNKRPSTSQNIYIAPSEPLAQVPFHLASSKDVSHQVKTGAGAQYLHLCSRPEYLDSMDRPYAIFTFKYRSKKVVEKMFGIKIKEEGQGLKARLADMSKDELADELFAMRMANRAKSSTSSHRTGASTMKTDKKDTSKAPSVAKSNKTASKKPEAATGWDTQQNNTIDWGTTDSTPANNDNTWDNTTPNNDNTWDTTAENPTWETTNDAAPAKPNTRNQETKPQSIHSHQSKTSKTKPPGSWPETSTHSSQAKAGAASTHSKTKSGHSKKPRSEAASQGKKEEVVDAWGDKSTLLVETAPAAAGGWDQPATGAAAAAGDWEDKPVEGAAAGGWDNTAAGAGDWNNDTANANDATKWSLNFGLLLLGLTIAITICSILALFLGFYTTIYTNILSYYTWLLTPIAFLRNTFSTIMKAISVLKASFSKIWDTVVGVWNTLFNLGDVFSGAWYAVSGFGHVFFRIWGVGSRVGDVCHGIGEWVIGWVGWLTKGGWQYVELFWRVDEVKDLDVVVENI